MITRISSATRAAGAAVPIRRSSSPSPTLAATTALAVASRLAAALALAAFVGGCASLPWGEHGEPDEQAAPAATEAPAAASGAAAQSSATQSSTTDAADNEGPLPRVELTREILFQVLAAEMAAQNGEMSIAASTYLSLAQSTRDPRFARRATELALAERSLDHALRAAQLWYELAPDAPNASQTIEALWLSTGRMTEAEPLLARRLARSRTEATLPGTYTQLQRVLSRAPDKKAALAMLERLSQPDRQLPEARLALAGLAAHAGDRDRALTEANEATRLRPDSERVAISAAQYVQQSGQGTQGAEAILSKFLARKPKSVDARFLYGRLLAADGRVTDARGQFETALKHDPDSPAILFSLAQVAAQLKQPQVAEGYLRRYVALPPNVQRDNAPAYLFLAQIAEEDKRYPQALTYLEEITRGEQYANALGRRAMVLGKMGRVDDARELLRNSSVETSRERIALTSAEAQVLRQAQRYQESFTLLDDALKRWPDNPELLYDQAMAAERVDRLPAMEASLRRLIELRPDHAHAYNALGYTLADRNIRLDEAKRLIEKALNLAPDDANIVDSMGWVEYRLGNLDSALGWLRKAYQARPEADVAAHLGEVLWKKGETGQARDMWRKAQASDPDNETLKETLARLNVAL